MRPQELKRLPRHPLGLDWPTVAWPTGSLDERIDQDKMRHAVRLSFEGGADAVTGMTDALLVIHRGRLVFEEYASGVGPGDTLRSWSLAKGFLNALYGRLVQENLVTLDSATGLAEWSKPGDPRSQITIRQLLNMCSGLDFNEDHADPSSDSGRMLWGAGAQDMGAYAIERPLRAQPGSRFSYSSGDSMILATILRRALESRGLNVSEWIKAQLLDPLGMSTAILRYDEAGTWIASSYLFASARDFARLGYLFLRGGRWHGVERFPDSWVDFTRSWVPASKAEGYGAHFWLTSGRKGIFFADGYEGQRILIDPTSDLVIVRLGKTALSQQRALQEALAWLVASFDQVGPAVH